MLVYISFMLFYLQFTLKIIFQRSRLFISVRVNNNVERCKAFRRYFDAVEKTTVVVVDRIEPCFKTY